MSNVRVAVRCRPFNSREEKIGAKCVIKIAGKKTTIDVPTSKEPIGFTFDYSYWSFDPRDSHFASQEAVFADLGTLVLDSAFEGYNSCVFAYGQTGSGKSYTMMGSKSDPGLIPRICKALFERAAEKADAFEASHPTNAEASAEPADPKSPKLPPPSWNFRVEVSYLEIYCEKVKCMLKPTSKELKVREHPSLGPYVEGLAKVAVNDAAIIEQTMSEGNKARTVAATAMNEESSRSHAVFTLVVTQEIVNADGDGRKNTVVSKVHLVDLAGSERQSKTGAEGDRLMEGANINQSLSTLGKVIHALAKASKAAAMENKADASNADGKGGGKSLTSPAGKAFIPYRDSVLTWLLREALGGNSRTVMVATVSPDASNADESLSTLRYADSAKQIVTRPTVNEDPQIAMVRSLKAEILELRKLLSERGSSGGLLSPSSTTSVPSSPRGGGAQEQLRLAEALMAEMSQTWEDKVLESEDIAKSRHAMLEKCGVADSEITAPTLIHLHPDAQLSGVLRFALHVGRNVLGPRVESDSSPSTASRDAEQPITDSDDGQFIALPPIRSLQPQHAVIVLEKSDSDDKLKATIMCIGDNAVFVNGVRTLPSEAVPIYPKDRVALGEGPHCFFLFASPPGTIAEAASRTGSESPRGESDLSLDYGQASDELAEGLLRERRALADRVLAAEAAAKKAAQDAEERKLVAAAEDAAKIEQEREAAAKAKAESEARIAEMEREREAAAKAKAETEARIAEMEREREAAAKAKAEAELLAQRIEQEREAAAKAKAEAELLAQRIEQEREAAAKAKAESEAVAQRIEQEREAAAKVKAESETLVAEAAAKAKAESEALSARMEQEREVAAKAKAESEVRIAEMEREREASAKAKAEAEARIAEMEREREAAAKAKAEAELLAQRIEQEREAAAKAKAESEARIAEVAAKAQAESDARVAEERLQLALERLGFAESTARHEWQTEEATARLSLSADHAAALSTYSSSRSPRLSPTMNTSPTYPTSFTSTVAVPAVVLHPPGRAPELCSDDPADPLSPVPTPPPTMKPVLSQKIASLRLAAVSADPTLTAPSSPDAVPNRRWRVIFLGHEEVGKTSLRKCLAANVVENFAFRFAKKLPSVASTTGMEVSRVTVDLTDDEAGLHRAPLNLRGPLQNSGGGIDLHIVDFAGQEVYASHLCFLTGRALYVLVWKMSTAAAYSSSTDAMSREEERLLNWVDEVQAHAEGSDLMLIGTHLDTIPDKNPLTVMGLLARVGTRVAAYVADVASRDRTKPLRIVGNFGISSKTREVVGPPLSDTRPVQLPALLKHIAIMASDGLRRDTIYPYGIVPSRHMGFIRLLIKIREQRTVHTLSSHDFIAMAASVGLDNRHEVEVVSRLLHDWGIVYLFGGNEPFSDAIFLRPQWLFETVPILFAYWHVLNTPAHLRESVDIRGFEPRAVFGADDKVISPRGSFDRKIARALFSSALAQIGLNGNKDSDLDVLLRILSKMELISRSARVVESGIDIPDAHRRARVSLPLTKLEDHEGSPFEGGSVNGDGFYATLPRDREQWTVPTLFPLRMACAPLADALTDLLRGGNSRMIQFNVLPRLLISRLHCRLASAAVWLSVPSSLIVSSLQPGGLRAQAAYAFATRLTAAHDSGCETLVWNRSCDSMWLGTSKCRLLLLFKPPCIYLYSTPRFEEHDVVADKDSNGANMTSSELLASVLAHLEVSMKDFTGVSVMHCVPCQGHMPDPLFDGDTANAPQVACDNYFSIDAIAEAEVVTCQTCSADFNAKNLLTGVANQTVHLRTNTIEALSNALGSGALPSFLSAYGYPTAEPVAEADADASPCAREPLAGTHCVEFLDKVYRYLMTLS